MQERFRRPRYKSADGAMRRGYDVERVTPKIEPPRRRQSVSAFWLAPLIAAIIGIYLAISFFTSQGPDIQIEFASAEGLIAGKTPLRYRDVNIGVVDKIWLSEDLESVIVRAKMTVDSRRYLNKHARFWVVRPRVGASGVSGLNTLLSGAYIQVNSILDDSFQSEFVGLEQPPLTDEDAPGLRLKLQARQAGYVGVGSPVYYRQVKVGQIEGQRFLDNYDGVEFTIFVDDPHHEIIRNTTKFWNVSGLDLTLNSSGFKFRTPSIEGLAQGGVAFDIIEEYEFPRKVEDGYLFTLHESREAATEDMIKDVSSGKLRYVVYFEGSVRGLSRGAPVEFRGVQIGRVTDIKLVFDKETEFVRVPVYIELQPERVRGFREGGIDRSQLLESSIARGLRAKLQTGSLLTGQLYVSLDTYDDSLSDENISRPLSRDADGVYIMPSEPSDLDQVTEGVENALAKINALPLEELLVNGNSTIERANRILAQFEEIQLASKIDGAIGSADRAIDQYARLASGARKELNQLSTQLQRFVSTAGDSMEGIAPDSPLYYNLLNTLRDVQAASRAVLAVSESVEKKPEEFLFGK